MGLHSPTPRYHISRIRMLACCDSYGGITDRCSSADVEIKIGSFANTLFRLKAREEKREYPKPDPSRLAPAQMCWLLPNVTTQVFTQHPHLIGHVLPSSVHIRSLAARFSISCNGQPLSLRGKSESESESVGIGGVSGGCNQHAHVQIRLASAHH
jgi:hypothetical protein